MYIRLYGSSDWFKCQDSRNLQEQSLFRVVTFISKPSSIPDSVVIDGKPIKLDKKLGTGTTSTTYLTKTDPPTVIKINQRTLEADLEWRKFNHLPTVSQEQTRAVLENILVELTRDSNGFVTFSKAHLIDFDRAVDLNCIRVANCLKLHPHAFDEDLQWMDLINL